MSKRRDSALKAVAEVRRFQYLAAETRAAEALKACRQLEVFQYEALTRLQEGQGSWSQSMRGPGLDLTGARCWLAEIEARHGQWDAISIELAEAHKTLEEAQANIALAIGGCRVADGMVRAAVHARARKREEAMLSEATDRFAHRVLPI
jgi:hypothetical protein